METKYRTAVVGFPRIGKTRELKFESEKFFKGACTAEELLRTARELREYGWKKQQDAGITFIPSNDFSFYDNMLDTAVLLGAVPERYRALRLPHLETYFAMAHGYQGANGDVKALPMKKWFNTNYHYLVPELSDGTVLSADAADNKALSEFREAKALGIQTVPSLIGPCTFLRLSTYCGKKDRAAFSKEAVDAYAAVAKGLSENGAEWISFAEPALVFDTSKEEADLFSAVYAKLLSRIRKETQLRVICQTYFGDIRDSYRNVVSAGFDAIGLDFVEGKKSLDLVRGAFPEGTLLFAGAVNGKNIWRTDYRKVASLCSELEKSVPPQNIVLGTSCSLLHVPYTTSLEASLGDDVVRHFAFAEEKLQELHELSLPDEAALSRNVELFSAERTESDAKVRAAVASLGKDDSTRNPPFAERERIQREEFDLPLFPTTTIGSFPQTKEVRTNRAAFRKGTISRGQYVAFNRERIAECIKLQEDIGLDVLVHGEFERNDMVEYFGNHLNGFVFTDFGWVQSYGTRCVKPPVVWGDVSRRESITVEWSVFAQSCTKKPMKGMLTGPVTILNWSFPREDLSLRDQAFQIALSMREEVLDLERNGIRIIQIDEAALREKLPLRREDWHPEYLDWAIPAFRIVHAKVRPGTQIHTHMCYSEFNDIIGDIDGMDADVITFEASRGDLRILDALKASSFRTQVGPGVYDIHSPRVPSAEEMESALSAMLRSVPAEKLWVNPDCGLKTRELPETEKSLRNMVRAAQNLREKHRR